MAQPDPASITPLLLEAARLKHLDRAGWRRRGLHPVESVAAHSWGVAWLVTLLLPPELDRAKALTYAVLHDLAEVRVGDITPHDGVAASTKADHEARAMTGLLGAVDPGLLDAWQRYEAKADAEARFVHQLDRLDMAVQAAVYRDAHDVELDEFFRSAAAVITDPGLRAILEALQGPQ